MLTKHEVLPIGKVEPSFECCSTLIKILDSVCLLPRLYVGQHTRHDVSINSERLDNRLIRKVTVSLGLLSPPIASFSGIHKVKDILINLTMERSN